MLGGQGELCECQTCKGAPRGKETDDPDYAGGCKIPWSKEVEVQTPDGPSIVRLCWVCAREAHDVQVVAQRTLKRLGLSAGQQRARGPLGSPA